MSHPNPERDERVPQQINLSLCNMCHAVSVGWNNCPHCGAENWQDVGVYALVDNPTANDAATRMRDRCMDKVKLIGDEVLNTNNKEWYVGAMNDGLFVIDAPPRPSTDDITDQPNVNVIAAMGTNREAADLLVAEHNGRIAAREAAFTEIGVELRRYGASIRKVDLMARFQELFREGGNGE